MKSQQKTLLGLAALFLAPLIVALVIFFGPASWYPEPLTAGTLVTPARQLEEFSISDLNGRAVTLAQLKGRWTLVYPQNGGCSVECAELLSQLVQLKAALGEDRHRLSLVHVVVEPGSALAGLQELARDLRGLTVLLETQEQQRLLSQLGWQPEQERIYLIDALGNYLMYYAAGDGPRPILGDLEHLMKHSANG